MKTNGVQKIVIVGGGTAGWMTAAALSHFLNPHRHQITLIESDAIGTVGVGEATVPHLRFFNETLGINEQEFMERTQATYKLGIEFSDWGKIGDSYFHPFGIYGNAINDISFHHYWLRQRLQGDVTPIGDYSLAIAAAKAGKFIHPQPNPQSPLSKFSYAFHINATLYAAFLREYSEKKGLVRVEGKISQVTQNTSSGNITNVVLESGEVFGADLFIDCSGFRGLLISQTLGAGFDDWSHWLPCDRAIAVPSQKNSAAIPYTKAIAKKSGWQWRIPLRNRCGNGQVYCSGFSKDDEIADDLLRSIDGKPLADLHHLRFKAGRRQQSWVKNCIAIGLSSGFLEPLESTSIYLIQVAITKLIEFFPDNNCGDFIRAEFNREIAMEYERIRDFLILHYHATTRDDSEFWNYCRTMPIPESLAYKLDLFRAQGVVERYTRGIFLEPSWLSVYVGQGIFPHAYHPAVNRLSTEQLAAELSRYKQDIEKNVRAMPVHEDYCLHKSSTYTTSKPSMNLYGVA